MRFKNWLHIEYSGGTANADMLQGGRTELPASRINTNMPVQSRISCKDGSSKIEKDPYDYKIKPEQLFDFKTRKDKNASKEREANWIDTDRRKARFVSIPPDITY